MTRAERLARVGLTRVVEPGSGAVAALVADHGPEAVWESLRRGERLPGLSAALVDGATHRAAVADPQAELRALAASGGRLLCPGDEDWPAARLDWPLDGLRSAPPLALYLRGERDLAQVVERSVSVVGARASTAYGSAVAGELGLGLAEQGCAVVSGGAYGIDGAAHRGALAGADRAGGAPTVAVLACGVDVAYPRGHTRLLAEVAQRGLLVSEVPPGSAPLRSRFLVRNRLIAALTRGTVVVEAALRSGSLSTAARAEELSRPVLAVPGPVTSVMSAGCHELLRQGAVCVTGAAQVLDAVGMSGQDLLVAPRGEQRPRDGLPEQVRRVLEAVPVRRAAGEASIARLAGVATLAVQQVLPPLLVAGLVERVDGGYRLTPLGAGRPVPAPR